ncbi:HK97-gp10 family putative phage morphogenesis protein [Flavobacterium sp. ASV13]|uniref:HK97-gp10 family putative phage morphogenesis protein n=1 Tax=Flavobacterium sp. ASV13 TaxID=1506583 RepID=UPI00055019C4|nr:HK97-gp10 family putative phage morphogenesis protein [Flavobacterium sp. ASV13]
MNSPLMQVTGFEELKAKIRELGNDKDKKREVLIILRQVASPTLQAARSFVPVASKKHKARGKLIEPGNLKKSLGYITGKQENPTIYVGARAKGVNNGWYAHFVEHGVNKYSKGYKRKRKRRANNHAAIGKTKATPFMATAYQSTNGQVTADAQRKMAAFIQRRIDKLSR